MIHVKRYGGSSPLSHLFAQGVNSSELFQADRQFRTKVNERLQPSHRLADPDARPEARDYCVVFAIVSQSAGPLQIPFFSRLSLRHAIRRLDGYGYRVALTKIEVSEEKRVLEDFTQLVT